MRLRLVALLVLAAVPVPAAGADELTLVSKVTGDKRAPSTAMSYIGTGKMRMVQPGGSELLVDYASGEITVIDGRKKEYYVVTPQDLEEMSARLQEQAKAMEPRMQKTQEQMKNMPPEARRMMEKMMGGMMSGLAAAVTVEKGESRKVAGYACQAWTISVGEMSRTEQCVTTALPTPQQAGEHYRLAAGRMRTMMTAAGPMAKGLQDMQEKTKDIQGIPLYSSTTTTVLGRTSSNTTEVTEVRKGPVPDAAWAIPAGYTKAEAPFKKTAPPPKARKKN